MPIKSLPMAPNELSGRNILVVGLGRFGGQIAAARWLVEQGARVTVTDLAPAENLAESLAQLADLPIRYRARTYGSTNIRRWSHGWLLLRMVSFAARRIKFT